MSIFKDLGSIIVEVAPELASHSFSLNDIFLENLDFSDLDFVDFIVKVEDRWNIVISDRDAVDLVSIRDVVGYLSSRGIT